MSKKKEPRVEYRVDEQAEKIGFQEIEIIYNSLFEYTITKNPIIELINRGNYNKIKGDNII